MIDKILATIDDSDRSQAVFDTAVSLAQITQAKLIFVHVLSEEDSDYPILPTYAYYSVLKGNDNSVLYHKFNEYQRQQAEILSSLTKKAIALGANAEYLQISGTPGYEICELAARWTADLIIVGSRDLKGLKEMFLGSVSNYVTHHAPCSVLIVRSDGDYASYSIDLSSEKQAEINNQQVLK